MRLNIKVNKRIAIIASIATVAVLGIGAIVAFIIIPNLNNSNLDSSMIVSPKTAEMTGSIGMRISGASLKGISLNLNLGINGKVDISDEKKPKVDMSMDISSIRDMMSVFSGGYSYGSTFPSEMRVVMFNNKYYLQDPKSQSWTVMPQQNYDAQLAGIASYQKDLQNISQKYTKTGEDIVDGQKVNVYTVSFDKDALNKAVSQYMNSYAEKAYSSFSSYGPEYSINIDKLNYVVKVTPKTNILMAAEITMDATMKYGSEEIIITDLTLKMSYNKVNQPVTISEPELIRTYNDINNLFKKIYTAKFDAQASAKFSVSGIDVNMYVGVDGKLDESNPYNTNLDATVDLSQIKNLLEMGDTTGELGEVPNKIRIILVDQYLYIYDEKTGKWTKSATDCNISCLNESTSDSAVATYVKQVKREQDETLNGKIVKVYTISFDNDRLDNLLQSQYNSKMDGSSYALDDLIMTVKVDGEEGTPVQVSITADMTVSIENVLYKIKDIKFVMNFSEINKPQTIKAPSASQIAK